MQPDRRPLVGQVCTSRSDVQFVVTEFGVADLRGTTIAQRLKCLLDIAHPEDRAALEAEAFSALRAG